MLSSWRRLAVLLVPIVVIGWITTGCRYTPPELPGTAAARARLDRATELLVAADGSRVTISTVVRSGASEVSSTCASVATEPSSVAPERSEIVFGTYVTSAGICAPSAHFLVDGDTVYVPTDKLAPGRNDFLQNWAHISPEVRAAIVGSTPATGVPYSRLLDNADSLDDDGRGHLSVGVKMSALVKAGVLHTTPHVAENAHATVTFSFAADGSLSKAVYEITDGGSAAAVTVRQEYEGLNEPMGLVVPQAPFLNPESATLTTVAKFDGFVGVAL